MKKITTSFSPPQKKQENTAYTQVVPYIYD